MDKNDESKVRSFVHVEFEENGSALFNMIFENVTPAQVLAATAILEVKAKNAFIMQENERAEREAQTKLAVPPDKILLGKK